MESQRRPTGALETAVLEQVWASPDGLTARQVLEAMGGGLAYTTVMTIMNRLWGKGVLARERVGRAYRYSAMFSESELVAGRMAKALEVARDREATLSRFVRELTHEDENLLRSLLRPER